MQGEGVKREIKHVRRTISLNKLQRSPVRETKLISIFFFFYSKYKDRRTRYLDRASVSLAGATGYDGAWDIFDVFSKIGMAFFRSLLESLGRNDGAYEDEFLSRGMYPLKPTATDSIGGTIKELKSIPTDRGYMLIAVAPRSELANAVDLLQREVIVLFR